MIIATFTSLKVNTLAEMTSKNHFTIIGEQSKIKNKKNIKLLARKQQNEKNEQKKIYICYITT